jgi:exodeoxyribonuclease VII large subunit
VGEVLRQVKCCLEESFLPLLVVGEVANRRRPRSGHLYLTLRDATASLRVVVFRNVAAQAGDMPFNDGDEVLVWGRMSAYPSSGDLQLIADRIAPVGEGAFRARRERLRRRLDAEGLFAPERKRPVPFLPRSVGVVTSPTGAAIRDVLSTLERRFAELRVVIAGVRVNGLQAAPAVADAIQQLDARGQCDVLLVARGGGSQEDLAAFDDERVVRAIAACQTPVIVGVGHETDVTLADLVADCRAPTPTGAAELAVPVRAELERGLEQRARRLRDAIQGRLQAARRRLDMASRAHGLRATRVQLEQARQGLEAAERRLAQAAPRERLVRWREQLEWAQRHLVEMSRERLEAEFRSLDEAGRRLRQAGQQTLREQGLALAAIGQRLDSLSPLRVLARGYSLTTTPEGTLVTDARALEPGDEIHTRLAEGAVRAQVLAVEPPSSAPSQAS